MVNMLYRDISMMAGIRWDDTVEFYNPLPNGLPNYGDPLFLDGWHGSMTIKDRQGAAGIELLVLDDGANGGITIDPIQQLTIVATSEQTESLRGLVGFYELRVTPVTGSEFDDIAAVGRVYVEDL